jgi:hypothetical protein
MQDRPFRKPAYSGDIRRLWSIWSSSYIFSFLSSSFRVVFMRDMGLRYAGSWTLSLSLGIRTIFALFMLGGMRLARSTSLSSLFIIFTMGFPPYLSISAVIVSGPGAFLFGSDFMSCTTSWLESRKFR